MKTELRLYNHMQIEVVADALEFLQQELSDGIAGRAHVVAGRYLWRRANEILKVIEDQTGILPRGKRKGEAK